MGQRNAIADFDQRTISYRYENGWTFTNTFEKGVRVSVVPRRGELREPVEIVELRNDLFLVSWIDEEMGLLTQILDIEKGTVLAAIPLEESNRTQIIKGKIIE